MDVSQNICGGTHFHLIKQFVKSVYHSFSMDDGVRFGLVSFGNNIVKVTNLFSSFET